MNETNKIYKAKVKANAAEIAHLTFSVLQSLAGLYIRDKVSVPC